MLGLSPDAPAGLLYVDPHLPEWLPDLTLSELLLGKDEFDLCFERQADGTTTFTVLRGPVDKVVRRSLSEARRDLSSRVG